MRAPSVVLVLCTLQNEPRRGEYYSYQQQQATWDLLGVAFCYSVCFPSGKASSRLRIRLLPKVGALLATRASVRSTDAHCARRPAVRGEVEVGAGPGRRRSGPRPRSRLHTRAKTDLPIHHRPYPPCSSLACHRAPYVTWQRAPRPTQSRPGDDTGAWRHWCVRSSAGHMVCTYGLTVAHGRADVAGRRSTRYTLQATMESGRRDVLYYVLHIPLASLAAWFKARLDDFVGTAQSEILVEEIESEIEESPSWLRRGKEARDRPSLWRTPQSKKKHNYR